jgi:hypothetical protein
MQGADTETMFDVSNYLYWGSMSGLDFKFDLTDADLNWITASVNRGIWNKYNASPEETTLPSYELM